MANRTAGTGTVSVKDWIDVLRRDPCSYCGADGHGASHVDHIEPRVRLGGDSITNATAVCHACNQDKKDVTLLGFLLRRQDPLWQEATVLRSRLREITRDVQNYGVIGRPKVRGNTLRPMRGWGVGWRP